MPNMKFSQINIVKIKTPFCFKPVSQSDVLKTLNNLD